MCATTASPATSSSELLSATKSRDNNNMEELVVPYESFRKSKRSYYGCCYYTPQTAAVVPIVAGSVLIYWLFVSLIPIYNKFFFQKSMYPYPIATAGIQLGVVAILLAVVNVVRHFTDKDSANKSWIGGPHLLWKLKWCTPIGVLFGLKYGVTNLGLHLVAAPTHLLLQATDLVWTVLSAWIINKERLTKVEVGCLLGCVAGSFVLSWRQLTSQQHGDESHKEWVRTEEQQLFAIFINLLSPMLLGLCIATLRLACCGLMRPDNRVGGTVTAVELTTIKLVISSTVALLLATAFERGSEDSSNAAELASTPSWWQAFDDLSSSTKAGVMGGAILIAVFQVNCTYLTHLTSAVSVGLVGQVKIIPQWVFAVIFAHIISPQFNIQGPNLIGAILIMASAATFAGSKFYTARQQRERETTGLALFDNSLNKTDESPFSSTTSSERAASSSSNEDRDEECPLLCCAGSNDSNLHLLTDGDEWATGSIRANYDSIGGDVER